MSPARVLAVLALLTPIPAIVGWLVGVRWLVQPLATFAPARPWGSLLAVVAAGALLIKLSGRTRVARRWAFATGALAVVGVALEMAGVRLPGDAWIWQRTHAHTPLAGDAIPLPIGVLYSVYAIALTLLIGVDHARNDRRQLVVGGLASLQVALAGALFLAQLVGLPDSATMAPMRAPLPALVAAFLLGVALLQRLSVREHRTLAAPRWAPLLVGVSGTLLVVLLWQALRVREQGLIRTRDANTLTALERAVQRQFRTVNRAVGRTAMYFSAARGVDDVAWRTTMPRLVAETDGLQRFVWIDTAGRVLQAMPSTPSLEPLRAALTQFARSHAGAAVAADVADPADTLTSAHTGLLADNPDRLVLWYPALSPLVGPTLLLALIDERELLHVLAEESARDVALRVTDGDTVLLSVGTLTDEPSHGPLRIGRREFSVAMSQGRGGASTLPEVVLTLGLAVVGLLAVTLWLQRRIWDQARREGVARMQRAIEGATDGVWEVDVRTGRASRSAALSRHLGVDGASNAAGLIAWTARVHPDDAPRVTAAFEAHLAGHDDVFEVEYRVQAGDGSWHTLVDRGRVVERDASGHPTRVLGVSADVTERARAEAARDASERRYRAMFDTAYQVQLLLDLDGRILEANRAGAELALTTTEGLQGIVFWRAPWWAADARTIARVEERFHRAVAGEMQRFEVEIPVGRERPITVDFSLTPIVDAQRVVTQVIAEGRDLTLRIRAEEALRETSTLTTLGQLAARVAHEVNNPLAGIQNAFLLVRGAIPTDHPHYGFVGAIEREIGRIAAVTRQLYETYRPDQLLATQASMILAVGDAVSFLEQVNRARQVRIETDLTQAPSVVPVPDALLRQALYNLIQNAVDVSPSGGTVRVRAFTDGDTCALTVSDEGPGVPEALRERIFEPFFSTKDRTTKTGGMGIGLALVRQSVLAVGGRISVRDRHGGGAVFEVRLPLTPIESGALT